MASIFTKIIDGEIPCAKVWENDEFFAFLDIRPMQPGHTIVVPKKEVDYIFDMEKGHAMRLMAAAHDVAQLVKKGTGCERVCVAVVGWEVRHVHVHLIPTNRIEDFPVPPQSQADPKELEALAAKIRAAG